MQQNHGGVKMSIPITEEDVLIIVDKGLVVIDREKFEKLLKYTENLEDALAFTLAAVPLGVKNRIGNALREEKIFEWWITTHSLLGNRSPRQLWENGETDRVLVFIDSAKSGDMA